MNGLVFHFFGRILWLFGRSTGQVLSRIRRFIFLLTKISFYIELNECVRAEDKQLTFELPVFLILLLTQEMDKREDGFEPYS